MINKYHILVFSFLIILTIGITANNQKPKLTSNTANKAVPASTASSPSSASDNKNDKNKGNNNKN